MSLGNTAIPGFRKEPKLLCSGYPREEPCKGKIRKAGKLEQCPAVVVLRAPNQKRLCPKCRKQWDRKIAAPRKKGYQKKYQEKLKARRRAERAARTPAPHEQNPR